MAARHVPLLRSQLPTFLMRKWLTSASAEETTSHHRLQVVDTAGAHEGWKVSHSHSLCGRRGLSDFQRLRGGFW